MAVTFNMELLMDNGQFMIISQDGSQRVRPPYNYQADGFATAHNAACVNEPKFLAAYSCGVNSGHGLGEIDVRWRVHQCIWAANHALHLDGDFVECGVNTGIFSLSVMKYFDFNSLDRDFYLFDTFEGAPQSQYTPAEISIGIDKVSHFGDCWDIAQRNFAPYKRAHLVKGMVPDSLSKVNIEKVAYLCIDMNAVAPEVAAIKHFWPKLVPGAIVIFDDYNWVHHRLQKEALDAFTESVGVKILNLPSGQGIAIKP